MKFMAVTYCFVILVAWGLSSINHSRALASTPESNPQARSSSPIIDLTGSELRAALSKNYYYRGRAANNTEASFATTFFPAAPANK